MTADPLVDIGRIDDVITRVVDLPLSRAAYVRSPPALNWSFTTDDVFVALSALGAIEGDRVAYTFVVGWRYEAFGDPPPDPLTAYGCVRGMTLDQLGRLSGTPLGAIGIALDEALADFEQRLATVVRKHVVRWVESWKRPDGFRDFLAAKNYHLAAAWASALLGHAERARLELAYAAHLYNQPLDSGFDRMRADHDGALAAVFAARNGLAALLASSDEQTVSAFTSERGEIARNKVLEPHTEHLRMQLQHSAFADTCVRYLTGHGG